MDDWINERSVVSPYRIEHLGLNVVLQLLVGVPLEMVHGATRIGLVYVAGVVAGRQVGPLSIGETSLGWLGLPMGSGKPRLSGGPGPLSPKLLTVRLFLQAILPTSLGNLEKGLPPREGGM